MTTRVRARRAGRATRGLLLLVVGLLAAAGLASAHGDAHKLEAQLVKDGEKVLVGGFTAAQQGPLVVVPYVETPVPCGGIAPGQGVTVPLGPDGAVTFLQTPQGLHALVDGPPTARGYAGLAVDSGQATRALLLMQENAVALHGLVGLVWRAPDDAEARTGVLGIPYPIPGEGHGHAFGFTPEGGGILLDHDGSFGAGTACAGGAAGHQGFFVPRDAFPVALEPGRLVHALALFDPDVAAFLPRPIDDSTRLLQANLYLARPHEDPIVVRDALQPSWDLGDAIPLVGVALGVLGVARKR